MRPQSKVQRLLLQLVNRALAMESRFALPTLDSRAIGLPGMRWIGQNGFDELPLFVPREAASGSSPCARVEEVILVSEDDIEALSSYTRACMCIYIYIHTRICCIVPVSKGEPL